MTARVYIHVFDEEGNKMGGIKVLNVPRVGDEIRWAEDLYFRVTRIVHCFDEKTADFNDRVNLQMERIE